MSSKTYHARVVPPIYLPTGGPADGADADAGKSKSACIGAEINIETEEEKRLLSVGRDVYRIM